ncbi:MULTISPECIES: hypothetical protein [unclassified Streptomyces]|uniref:hypothetical protein n=1 Tax=unclassified Streptomyces TaxID=2593676 RepID=UPI0022514FEB|nr:MULTISPECIES: hypothetical protein [unclassified Streptomyces]MCX5321612.1 IS110 family transposase [Streptomyces sp. NBC_00120]
MADEIAVVGGADTQTDFHQATVIDPIGRHLATEAFATTPCGNRQLLHWLRSHGEVASASRAPAPTALNSPGTYGPTR